MSDVRGPADYLRLGDWNIRCDRCGKKMKGSEAALTWQGYYVCQKHWEPRQPQDFVRSIVEHPTPPFVRNPPDLEIGSDTFILETDSPLGADINYLLQETATNTTISFAFLSEPTEF